MENARMHRQIAQGAGWMVLFKLVDRALGIVSTLVLARLLLPADFGLVAMAMSVIAIVELATAFSFEVALIQRATLTRAHYDTAWTLNLLLAAVCASVTAAIAWPTAAFYAEPRLVPVMLVLAGGFAVSGLENPGIVDFRRALDFRREFYFLSGKRALSFAVTITLALALRSYWALVAGAIAGRLFGVTLSYLLHRFRPRPCLESARELFAFSIWMLANNVLSVLQAKVPHFAVGRLLGSQPLGLLSVGAEIAQIPTNDLAAPINRVVFPGFSRLAGDGERLRTTFLDVISVTALVGLPAAIGIAAVAEPIVLVLLGAKWRDAVPVIEVLAIASGVGIITSNNGSAYLAFGLPRLITLLATLRLVLLLPLAWILVARDGLIGAAYAELITAALALTASLPVLFRRLALSPLQYADRIWRPACASAAMAFAVRGFLDRVHMPESSLEALPLLLAAIAVGISSYAAAIGALWFVSGRPHGAERLISNRLMAWIRSAFGA